MKTTVKRRRCRRCQKRAALWRCRVCGILTCEHLCSLKQLDSSAVCWRCKS